MHRVSANYTMPTILNTLRPAASSGLQTALNPKAKAQATGSTSSTSSSSSSTGGSLGVTFLNLLAQELQNQDPTAPVDSTAMVGQMISLNQLDQLISINQILTPTSTTGTSATGDAQKSAASASDSVLGPVAGIAGTLSPSTAGAATTQLPFNPNTMMPYSSANAGAVAASINSSLNAATIGYSGTNNNTSGGK
jgi:flagellar basal-body rod modification protein FlgD